MYSVYSSEFRDGFEQRFSLVQVFADAPFLHADDLDDFFRDVAPLHLDDVDAAASARGRPPCDSDPTDASDVHVLQIAVLTDQIEDEAAACFVAQSPACRVARSSANLVERRVEDQFALFDPAARQPLDLHVELGPRPSSSSSEATSSPCGTNTREHPAPPLGILHVVLPQLGRHRSQNFS